MTFFLSCLKYDNQEIKWTHVLNLWEQDLGVTTDHAHGNAGRLRLVPKLTMEHLHLTPSLRMKVRLAAQVCQCVP